MEIQYPKVKKEYQVASTCNANPEVDKEVKKTADLTPDDETFPKLVSFKAIVLIIIVFAIVLVIFVLIRKKLSLKRRLVTNEYEAVSVVLLKP